MKDEVFIVYPIRLNKDTTVISSNVIPSIYLHEKTLRLPDKGTYISSDNFQGDIDEGSYQGTVPVPGAV